MTQNAKGRLSSSLYLMWGDEVREQSYPTIPRKSV